MRLALVCLLPLLLGPPEAVPLLRGDDPSQFELINIGADSIAIADGEIRLIGKPLGYFATKREYEDYVLTFEWKFDRPEGLKSDDEFRGNSGVLLHVARPHKVWPRSVEVQLAQADPGALFTFGDATLRGQVDDAAQKAAIRPVGEWNRAEITCRAGSIVCVLNGVEVARGEKAEPDRGAIAWQSEGKPVRFRDIRIRVLP